MMMDTFTKDELIRLFAIAGPLFATSIAILYDVGFFFGLNVSFFTFFSLTEHFVFALQAIPFAIPTALTGMALALVLWLGHQSNIKASKATSEKASSMTPEDRDRWIAKLQRQVRWLKIADPFVRGIFIALMFWFLSQRQYIAAFGIFAGQVLTELIYPIERLRSKEMRIALAAFAIFATWLAAFLTGMERAEKLMTASVASELISIEGGTIRANLVRGGDRGVLFVVFDTKKLNFLRWDAIKKIETL